MSIYIYIYIYITDVDYEDDIVLLPNIPTQAEPQLHSLKQVAVGIGLHVTADKTEFVCFNQKGDISTLNSGSLKLVDKSAYLGCIVSSAENDINIHLAKTWTAIDKLWIIWKSNLSDKIKRNFFQAAVVSILLHGCTTWTQRKRIEKKQERNSTRMLWVILYKSCDQDPAKQ